MGNLISFEELDGFEILKKIGPYRINALITFKTCAIKRSYSFMTVYMGVESLGLPQFIVTIGISNKELTEEVKEELANKAVDIYAPIYLGDMLRFKDQVRKLENPEVVKAMGIKTEWDYMSDVAYNILTKEMKGKIKFGIDF